MAAAGAALLLVLKAAGVLLLVLLALVLILLLVPVTALIRFAEGRFSLRAGLLGLSIPILTDNAPAPWLQKLLDRPQKPKRKKSAAPPEKPAVQKQKGPGEKLRLTVDELCTLAGGAGHFLRAVLGALRITQIRLYLPVHGEDAAQTAIRYGKMQAWLHGALGVLNNVFRLEFQECRLDPDYTGKLAGSEYFSCKISARLIIIGIAAMRLLWLLLEEDILDPLPGRPVRGTADR